MRRLIVKFKLNDNNDLYFYINELWINVELKACFPLKDEKNFFSVLNEDGVEVYLISKLNELCDSDKDCIEKYLQFKEFNFKIIGFYDVKDEFAVRSFVVKTTSGDMKFQTELDMWPIDTGNKTYMLQDLFGDRYIF